MKKACKACHFLTEDAMCPVCKGTDMSSRWGGLAIIFNPEKSVIAKKIGITQKGEYALIVL